MQNLDKMRRKIDDILRTFDDGDETFILMQISTFMAEHITYSKNHFDMDDVLFQGKGVCNGYALVFNALANRAGISSDICVGTAKSGVSHAWNRVTLKNGTVRFYDITFYDSYKNKKYLNSGTNFHSSYVLNDYQISP